MLQYLNFRSMTFIINTEQQDFHVTFQFFFTLTPTTWPCNGFKPRAALAAVTLAALVAPAALKWRNLLQSEPSQGRHSSEACAGTNSNPLRWMTKAPLTVIAIFASLGLWVFQADSFPTISICPFVNIHQSTQVLLLHTRPMANLWTDWSWQCRRTAVNLGARGESLWRLCWLFALASGHWQRAPRIACYLSNIM